MKKRGLLLLFSIFGLFILTVTILRPNSDDEIGIISAGLIEKKKETSIETTKSNINSLQPKLSEQSKERESPKEEAVEEKSKPLSLKEEISLIENKYPSILNKKGFTEHETEVILRFQVEDLKANTKAPVSAIERAVKELQLNDEKKRLLDEAFDETFLHLIEFNVDDIAACMSKRLSKSSECTKSVLDDFIKDLSQSLETEVFVITSGVTKVTQSAIRKAIDVCKEAPERAEVQFRLVFVECDPI